MKNRLGLVFFASVIFGLLVAGDLLVTHLMLPAEKLAGVTQEVYRILIVKWFCAGWVMGMLVMFFLVETWIWKNWRSWNKFCCDHHERVYRATMGLHKF